MLAVQVEDSFKRSCSAARYVAVNSSQTLELTKGSANAPCLSNTYSRGVSSSIAMVTEFMYENVYASCQ